MMKYRYRCVGFVFLLSLTLAGGCSHIQGLKQGLTKGLSDSISAAVESVLTGLLTPITGAE